MAIRQPQTIFKLCVCVHMHVIFIQVSKDPDYFYENMEIHVKICMVHSTAEVPHFASSPFPFLTENIPLVLQVNF